MIYEAINQAFYGFDTSIFTAFISILIPSLHAEHLRTISQLIGHDGPISPVTL